MEEKPAPPPAKPVRKRRWFQYSIRTLLILTAVSAALLAYWSHKARQQRDTVAAIKAAGRCSIQYDFQGLKLDSPPPWPKWLVDALGVDYFAKVTEVSLIGTPVTDADMQRLNGLTALEKLSLNSTKITDAGLAHLKALPVLQELDLRGTHVTDAGVEHLKGLTALQLLRLDGTQVTDAGVARLQQALPNCKIFRAYGMTARMGGNVQSNNNEVDVKE